MKHEKPNPLVGFSEHNHQRCVSVALHEAESYCQQHKLRFTKVRKRALSILLENHSAMGAYDLLDRLSLEGLGSKPPVAYRALAFLLDNGFIHKIEKLNAYIACSHPGAKHEPAFLICTVCGSVAEAIVGVTSNTRLTAAARQSGFQISHAIIEADGQCTQCQNTSGQSLQAVGTR